MKRFICRYLSMQNEHYRTKPIKCQMRRLFTRTSLIRNIASCDHWIAEMGLSFIYVIVEGSGQI